jgi:hypothetical protein
MYQLAGEVITGKPMETFSNAHMERGHASRHLILHSAKVPYGLPTAAGSNEQTGRPGCPLASARKGMETSNSSRRTSNGPALRTLG